MAMKIFESKHTGNAIDDAITKMEAIESVSANVTTLLPGQQATVDVTAEPTGWNFNFGIPQGFSGDADGTRWFNISNNVLPVHSRVGDFVLNGTNAIITINTIQLFASHFAKISSVSPYTIDSNSIGSLGGADLSALMPKSGGTFTGSVTHKGTNKQVTFNETAFSLVGTCYGIGNDSANGMLYTNGTDWYKGNTSSTPSPLLTDGTSGNGGAVKDYIIAYNNTVANGYRKWASGWMECWKRVDFTGAISTTWGNIFYSAPFALGNWAQAFASIPVVTATCVGSTTSVVNLNSAVSATSAGSAYVIRGSSTTSSTVAIHVRAEGNWK